MGAKAKSRLLDYEPEHKARYDDLKQKNLHQLRKAANEKKEALLKKVKDTERMEKRQLMAKETTGKKRDASKDVSKDKKDELILAREINNAFGLLSELHG